MRDEVYAQYSEERDNWLKRGRLRLIEVLMRSLPRPEGEAAILEIGAGVGQNVPTLQRFGVVDVAESAPMGLAALAAVPGIRRIYDDPVPFACEARYDVVGAFDVIEHLEDDHAAVRWVAELLVPGGHFIGLVPAGPRLFSDHDLALAHFRRYSARTLRAALGPPLEVVRMGHFNTTLFPAVALPRMLRRATPGEVRASPPRKESATVPAWLDRIFGGILAAEAALIERAPLFPYGVSLYWIARRRASG